MINTELGLSGYRRVFVAGHRGMVGSALVRRLESEFCTIIVAHKDLDLRDRKATESFLIRHRPDLVFHAAARVGGIEANIARPVEFLSDNIQLAASVIDGAYAAGVKRLIYLGSSCIYPRDAAQPIKEEALLSGTLESTNEAYAVAKIAGVTLCNAYHAQDGAAFNSVMPCNLYGPGDNYDPAFSHVPAALIRRFHEAKIAGASSVTIWGTGLPRREFLHVDDLADACIFAAKGWNERGILNAGFGEDFCIASFADAVAFVVGFEGEIKFDPARPDGAPRKLMDSSRLRSMGWKPKYGLRGGLNAAYQWFLAHHAERVAA